MATTMAKSATKGKGRGFASMDPVKQKAIASKGGKAAHKKGTAHTWTSDEARAAGQKGGRAGISSAYKAVVGQHSHKRFPEGKMKQNELNSMEQFEFFKFI